MFEEGVQVGALSLSSAGADGVKRQLPDRGQQKPAEAGFQFLRRRLPINGKQLGRNYRPVTLAAAGPFWPCSMVNSTR